MANNRTKRSAAKSGKVTAGSARHLSASLCISSIWNRTLDPNWIPNTSHDTLKRLIEWCKQTGCPRGRSSIFRFWPLGTDWSQRPLAFDLLIGRWGRIDRLESLVILSTGPSISGTKPNGVLTMIFAPPSVHIKSYGKRVFSNYAPTLWNNLPVFIRSSPSLQRFRSALKTHLFREAFNIWFSGVNRQFYQRPFIIFNLWKRRFTSWIHYYYY